jgi:hypothetical protein
VILMMLFMPKGLVGIWDWITRRPAAGGVTSPAVAPPPDATRST